MHKIKQLIFAFIVFLGLAISSVASAAQKDLLILFSDGSGLSTSASLYDYNEWYMSKYDNPKRIDALLKEGWSLLQVVPVNAKQHYWIFVK